MAIQRNKFIQAAIIGLLGFGINMAMAEGKQALPVTPVATCDGPTWIHPMPSIDDMAMCSHPEYLPPNANDSCACPSTSWAYQVKIHCNSHACPSSVPQAE